jgi:hypothetical protein
MQLFAGHEPTSRSRRSSSIDSGLPTGNSMKVFLVSGELQQSEEGLSDDGLRVEVLLVRVYPALPETISSFDAAGKASAAAKADESILLV